MISIPLNNETEKVARRVIWFEKPQQALADPVRFMAYAMRYAMPRDMSVIEKYIDKKDLKYAIDHAPPGIIDPRSWAYWNMRIGRYPAPKMPERMLN